MLNSFYDIRPLEEWLDTDPGNGLIYHNKHAISTLSVTPSSPLHTVIFPVKVVYEPTDLDPGELFGLFEAEMETKKRVMGLTKEDGLRVLRIYEKWMNDEALNKQMNDMPKERISRVLEHLGEELMGFTHFANIGENVGQIVKHYHFQLVPRYTKGGAGEILLKHEHPDG
jgi:diadenosine tetraphosphate (Ap4A) HIT family hydrolase